MEGYNLQKEMSEAIQAGENALCSLRAAREELQKAGNWGIVDLFGGGFITNLIKHSKMDNASNTDLSIDCGGFLTFADFFLDGGVADWLVQSKINDAKRQVDDAIAQVEQILRRLKQY